MRSDKTPSSAGRHFIGRKIFAVMAALSIIVGGGTLIGVSSASATTAPVSQAAAQAVNINLLGLKLNVSTPATSVKNNGSETTVTKTATPSISLLTSTTEKFLSAGALSQTATAEPDGTSYACAGIVQPTAVVRVGAHQTSCSSTGTGTGGVTLNLLNIPGVGTITGLLGTDLAVHLNAVTAFATEADNGTASGSADLTGGTVTLTLLTVPYTVPLTIPSTPNATLLTAVVKALNANPLLGTVASLVTTALSPVLKLTTNYQPDTSPDTTGAFQVSALHIAVLGGAASTANLAVVTVGPNTTPPAPTIATNGISPASGPTAGGTTVTITGTNLSGATAVDFGTGNPGTIVSDTGTKIVVKDPAHTAGAVTVTVTTPGGTSNGETFTFTTPPPAPGSGYWEVASDGGVFTFGTAKFHGSMGSTPLNKPVVGMAEDPATGGYWLVAGDGGIFSFTAPFYGSMGSTPLNAPIVGMAAMRTGGGACQPF